MEDRQFLFRAATTRDTGRILRIISQAQAQMRRAGSLQWQDGYPSATHIETDLARGAGRVLCIADSAQAHGREPAPDAQAPVADTPGRVIAYAAVIFDGEPAYETIEGAWRTPQPYVVVHRLAVADGYKGCGVARAFLRRVEEEARAEGMRGFRIDTNFDNRPMLHLLERLGFTCCGKICYQSGERLAFEKGL